MAETRALPIYRPCWNCKRLRADDANDCANCESSAAIAGPRVCLMSDVSRVLHDSRILRNCGIVEISVHNDTGSVREYMEHWEGRTLKAENQIAALTARAEAADLALEEQVIAHRDTAAQLSAAEARYQRESMSVDNVWAALGISTFEQAQGKDIATHVSEIRARLQAAEATAKANREIACEVAERDLWVVGGLESDGSVYASRRWCNVRRLAIKEGRVDHHPWCAFKTGIYPRLDVIADNAKHMLAIQDELKAAEATEQALREKLEALDTYQFEDKHGHRVAGQFVKADDVAEALRAVPAPGNKQETT